MPTHPRPYYCSHCHIVAPPLGPHPPKSWFGLHRYHSGRPTAGGLFCSAACLQGRVAQFVEREAVAAAATAQATRQVEPFIDPTMA